MDIRTTNSIDSALNAILADQNADGHWRYDVEPFVMVTSLHVITLHYANEKMDPDILGKIGRNLRGHQLDSGGWGLAPMEEMVLSNSVLAYFALRLIGDRPEDEHMLRARKSILAAGGVEGVNNVTRFNLALFGIIPWDSHPIIPVEILLLPYWFPFTIYKVAYWTRLAMVTMSVLQALDKRPKIDYGVSLEELFTGKGDRMALLPRTNRQSRFGYLLFKSANTVLKYTTHFIPAKIREISISRAISFCKDRLNGLDGLGSNIPSMYYVLMMYDALDYPMDHPDRVMAREALKRLVVVREEDAFTVACLSPTWDTVHVMAALLAIGEPRALLAAEKALSYLRPLQTLDIRGDWSLNLPNVRSGGWSFFPRNPHYPDTEDTALVILAMHQFDLVQDQDAISRGIEWLFGMQHKNGGWAAYESDNTNTYLVNMPSSIEEAESLLDMPYVDVTSTVVYALVQLGHKTSNCVSVRRGIDFILRRQEANGSWFGRWGVNYIYGTKMALCALSAAGVPSDHPSIAKGGAWLLSVQNTDGGWGEGLKSYNLDIVNHVTVSSTASQTAWAVIGLISANCANHPAVTAGIEYLLGSQGSDGLWLEEAYTGSAFPNLLMFRYSGYSKYFPLQALAQYRNMTMMSEG